MKIAAWSCRFVMVSGGVCMAYMWLWFMAWTENQINLDDLHKVLSYHHISHYSKEKVSEGNGVNNGFAASSEGGWKTKIGGDLLTLTNATEILGSITIIPNTFDPLKKKNWHKWIFWLTYTSYFFSKISHLLMNKTRSTAAKNLLAQTAFKARGESSIIGEDSVECGYGRRVI